MIRSSFGKGVSVFELVLTSFNALIILGGIYLKFRIESYAWLLKGYATGKCPTTTLRPYCRWLVSLVSLRVRNMCATSSKLCSGPLPNMLLSIGFLGLIINGCGSKICYDCSRYEKRYRFENLLKVIVWLNYLAGARQRNGNLTQIVFIVTRHRGLHVRLGRAGWGHHVRVSRRYSEKWWIGFDCYAA